MSDLGHIVCCGVMVPVTRIELKESQTVLTCTLAGPVAQLTGPVAIFGQDGLGIAQGGMLSTPRYVEAEEFLAVTVWLKVMEIDEVR